MAAGTGELAAFGTATCWGVSNQIQSAVGEKVGASSVTMLRQPYQVLSLCFLCLITRVDTATSLQSVFFFFLSGILGVCMCALLLYRSIHILGPSLGVLLMSLSSAFTAIISWIFLQETLPLQAVLGIAVTISGIIFVVTDHGGSTLMPGQRIPRGNTLALGVSLALCSALCLSVSFILLKVGMRGGTEPLWATFIRVSSASFAFWCAGLVNGWTAKAIRGWLDNINVRWLLLISCFTGSLGMWFSSVALHNAPAGVAATLIGLQPVMVTIIGAIWYRRLPSLRVLAGSGIAFLGTALLCFR